jgi:geranylgeranyl pyrophosphate synthase
MGDADKFFDEVRQLIDAGLDRFVPANTTEPVRLYEAIRWSLFGGGKRFRPALVFAVGKVFGADDELLIRTAVAVEMVHTYSLIHDDLPAMDDDDFRRGRETSHRRFGEATAILAGDALQALAFQVISNDESLAESTRVRLVSGLANAAADMVSGQQRDLDAEGKLLSLDEIRNVHRSKTGSLIRFSALAGAIIAEANQLELKAIAEYGSALGLLFQITDDLLDVTETSEMLGKTAGKDVYAGKATYPAAIGEAESRKLAATVYAEAEAALKQIERPVELLRSVAEFILYRHS